MWLEYLSVASILVGTSITIVWLISLVLKNTSIVDIFWGLGFVLLSWFFFGQTEGYSLRQLFVLALITLWGLRLATYIAIRNHGKPEDKRYAAWRREHSDTWWIRSFFTVFIFQGILMLIVSLPLYIAQQRNYQTSFTIMDIVAVVVVLFGITYEAVADWQLFRFKQNPLNSDKVCRKGLWRLSRHPNYFGELLVWWGFFGFTVNSPFVWFALPSPILMTVLLMKFSGVTLLESDLKESKPGYADYIRSTNALFPRIIKKT